MSHPALALRPPAAEPLRQSPALAPHAAPFCPVCFQSASDQILERFHSFTLHECTHCHLQFWEPRKMPDARWYSAMYPERNQRLHPLEPGHRFFLADPLAPRCGRLLDVGCGTGNFLIASTLAGYTVSGIELDTDAARSAARFCPRARVFPLPLESFRTHFPNEIFDVLTFFEVLEHQADPAPFLAEARACLRPRGFIALSVPNRNRWQTSMDALDYPPNHFLRRSPNSLAAAMKVNGFSIMSMQQERPTMRYSAQQINSRSRSGFSRSLAPELPGWFRDEIQQDPEKKEERHRAGLSPRVRFVQFLSRMKYAACLPLAAAALPYVRWRGYVGPYLYCLARKLD